VTAVAVSTGQRLTQPGGLRPETDQDVAVDPDDVTNELVNPLDVPSRIEYARPGRPLTSGGALHALLNATVELRPELVTGSTACINWLTAALLKGT
jgi:hypothetical protein